MDTSIELQQLKAAWQSLDRRLEFGQRLQLENLRGRKLRSARNRLLPLVLGQVALMVFGLALLLLGVQAWNSADSGALVIGCGVLLHIYGVLTLAGAGATIGKVLTLDFAAPVLAIQRRLLALERWYIQLSLALGLPWFVLWVAVWICLSKSDMGNPTWVVLNLALGASGFAAVLLLRAYARLTGRENWLRWLDESAGSRALARVRAQVGELDRFERE